MLFASPLYGPAASVTCDAQIRATRGENVEGSLPSPAHGGEQTLRSSCARSVCADRGSHAPGRRAPSCPAGAARTTMTGWRRVPCRFADRPREPEAVHLGHHQIKKNPVEAFRRGTFPALLHFAGQRRRAVQRLYSGGRRSRQRKRESDTFLCIVDSNRQMAISFARVSVEFLLGYLCRHPD